MWSHIGCPRYCWNVTRQEFWLTFFDPHKIGSLLAPWWRLKVLSVNVAEHPRFVSGFNPSSDSRSSSSRKMYAGKQKGPICSRPRPIGENSEPILADLTLANGGALVSDMVIYFKTWACSCRTRMCDAPESTIIVMSALESLSRPPSYCNWCGNVESESWVGWNCIIDACLLFLLRFLSCLLSSLSSVRIQPYAQIKPP